MLQTAALNLYFLQISRRFELFLKQGSRFHVDGITYGKSNTRPNVACPCSATGSGTCYDYEVAYLHHGSVIDIGCARLIFASLF